MEEIAARMAHEANEGIETEKSKMNINVELSLSDEEGLHD